MRDDATAAALQQGGARSTGDAIYEQQLRPPLDPADLGKIVAIDIETGAWEIDADEIAAGEQLAARCSDAQTWVVRVG